MPPRKRRGRARKAKGGGGKEKETSLAVSENDGLQLLASGEAEAIDQELLEAQSTIERLAKKYLRKSFEISSQSLDVVKSDSIVMSEPAVCDDGAAIGGELDGVEEDEKENRIDNSMTKDTHEDTSSPQAKITARKRKSTRSKVAVATDNPATSITRKVRHPRSKRVSVIRAEEQKRPFASPDFKIPQPKLGHSTPGDLVPSDTQRRDSLFGFGALESPLVLSPVTSMLHPDDHDSSNGSLESRGSPEETKTKWSGNKQLGTYDIPLRKPTPRNKKRNAKQKNTRLSLEEEEMIKKLTNEFEEVDNFELAVE